MSYSNRPLRYYPDRVRAPMLGDQVGEDRKFHFMEHSFDGSPYNIYDHNGKIRKDLPLHLRPSVSKVFPNFEGDVVRDSQAPEFYGCYSGFGNIILPPWHPLARPS